ncbi:MAG: hypothetical protein A2Z14_01590 [Chloroflexi bacterium RBG_16_48_8]|nr:MAG: hypothetical protein A2Z14_01590 [Chloroflexi bacterium RBG_16_48_8]
MLKVPCDFFPFEANNRIDFVFFQIEEIPPPSKISQSDGTGSHFLHQSLLNGEITVIYRLFV